MKLTSSAFADGGNIPKLYTCDGHSVSVPLSWSGAPKGTAWFAVTVIDPAGPVTHWYVINIPAATTGIKQGASLSTPGKQVSSWSGPCPGGGPDAYEFTVYAMPSSYKPPDTYAGYAQDPDGLAANAIGIGQLTGYYKD
jgi:Raf kinase inhibitor-like YbhB/YbcL family protein